MSLYRYKLVLTSRITSCICLPPPFLRSAENRITIVFNKSDSPVVWLSQRWRADGDIDVIALVPAQISDSPLEKARYPVLVILFFSGFDMRKPSLKLPSRNNRDGCDYW